MAMADQEREIYETPDSPIAESIASAPPEYESEYISHDHIVPSSARAAFDQSEINNARTDFGANKPVGWTTAARFETRHEKVTRLRAEIAALQNADVIDDEAIDLLGQLDLVQTSQRNIKTRTNHAGRDDNDRLVALESRLAVLEGRIGPDCLDVGTNIDLLHAKVQLLTTDTVQVESITRGLQPLKEMVKSKEMGTILKVNDMYESLKRIKEFSPNLKALLERLRDLKDIHSDAAELHDIKLNIKKSLASRQADIDEWKTALKGLQEQISGYGNTTQNNIEIIKRLTAEL